LSYELELLALAAMFYLYDSSALLYANEAILTLDGARGWSAHLGWTGFTLAGRSLCVLNPLTPYRLSFRLNWDFEKLEPASHDWSQPVEAKKLTAAAPYSLAAFVALFVILPLGLFTALGAIAIIPALVIVYGSTLIGLLQLRRQHDVTTLTRKQFWGLAFECLACPPFGANLVRHLTLKIRISEPLPLAGARLLDATRWDALRIRCIATLDEAISFGGENSPQRKSLEEQKRRLVQ
jgi:hypothetical protein